MVRRWSVALWLLACDGGAPVDLTADVDPGQQGPRDRAVAGDAAPPDPSEDAGAPPTADARVDDVAVSPATDAAVGPAPDAAIVPTLDAAIAPAPPRGALPRFAMPIHEEDRALIRATPIFGFDHDPDSHAGGARARCTNYDGRGFPFCYDQHDGTDFMLAGAFAAMDRGSARIVAAAGGEVVRVEDGHYDRCHADLGSGDIDCDGHPVEANRVHVRHANGWESRYLHMKKDSVAVRVGQRVDCGDLLGRVGSSGNSSAPHVHFEVHDPGGVSWDPFAGPESQPESLWGAQETEDGLPGAACDPAWGPAR